MSVEAYACTVITREVNRPWGCVIGKTEQAQVI
jgi:hypothetical protein